MLRNLAITLAAIAAIQGAGFAAAPAAAAQDNRLLTEWLFQQGTPGPEAPWTPVRIPHTWNATDAQKGGGKDKQSRDGYYRGPGNYVLEIGPGSQYAGHRVFIRFDAVATVAELWLDGKKVGQHQGGFTAFGFELTSQLTADGPNRLELRANNAWRPDVIPLSGDFSVCGGIYRPAYLLIRDVTCFQPVQDGTRGVTLRYGPASRERAELTVNAVVSHAGTAPASLRLRCTLRDAAGTTVAERATKLAAATPGEHPISVGLDLASPHLWNGVKDPYLYTLEVAVETDGKITDSLRLQAGFRDIKIDPAKGFFLNGAPYRLRGVCRHQDREGCGWALSKEQQVEDAQLIADMGVNAVRLAHYPHSQEFLDECDRRGLLVWAELPLVDTVGFPEIHPELLPNAVQQLKELIRQQGHHPAVFCWSLFNELGQRQTADPLAIVAELNRVAQAEDPTRPTVGATNKTDKKLCAIADIIAFNKYPGWYNDKDAETGMEKAIKNYAAAAPGKPWAISEYGAGGSIKHHDRAIATPPVTTGNWHPEEWQARVHEGDFAAFDRHPELWGTFLWNMFDFASTWRNEGDRPGVNDKGLVTFDRKTRKDAYYFYQANWAATPVLHLQSKRDTPTQVEKAVIRLYANVANLRLTLNGQPVEPLTRYAANAFATPMVTLQLGANVVEVTGTAPDGTIVRDTCTWERKP